MTINTIKVESKHQLKSYNTIVAMRLPGGYLAFSRYWTSKDASTTTKRHITTWCGGSISAIRDDLKYHWYMSLNEIDSDYLRAIAVVTGGRIG